MFQNFRLLLKFQNTVGKPGILKKSFSWGRVLPKMSGTAWKH